MLENKHCCYCGAPASVYDHVVPDSWTRKTGKRKTGGRSESMEHRRKNTVGSCEECNKLLSNFHLFTISERADYLGSRLAQRYKKTLSSPYWSEEEMQELGKSMRTVVQRKQIEKLETIDRIRHCNHVAKLEGMTIEDYWSD